MRPHHALLIALALLVGACAHREAIIRRTVAGLDAAHKSFEELDERAQLAIVERATTREAATAALHAHRAKRDKVADAFVAAYAGVAAAALDPSDLNVGRLVKLAVYAYEALKGFRP